MVKCISLESYFYRVLFSLCLSYKMDKNSMKVVFVPMKREKQCFTVV